MLDTLKTLKLWQIMALVVITLGTAGGVYGIYSWASSPSASFLPANTQLVPVQYGNIVNTVSASGSLVFPTRASLTFDSAGTVKELNVKAGGTVEKGRVLAKLDSASLTSLQKAVAQARINLKTAKDDLDKTQNPYTELDITQAEAAVVSAKVALKTAKDDLDKTQNPYTELDIVQAEATLANAEVALRTAQDSLDKAENPYTDSDITAAEAAVQEAQQKLPDAQARAPLDVADAELAEYKAYKTYFDSFYRYLENRISSDDWEKTKRDWERAKLNVEVAKQNAAKSVTDAENNLAEAEDTLADMKAGPDPLKVVQEQKQVDLAQGNLAKAKETLAELRAGADPLDVDQKQKQVAVAQANLAKAEETLAEMKGSPDTLQTELRQLEVASAQADLEEAQKRLEMVTMVAPFDGVVASVGVEAGQTVNANTVVIEVVDPSVVQMNATLSEWDIPQVKQGQKVTVSLDALPNGELSGKVSAISAVAKVTSGVVSYQITVEVTPPSGVQLREGLSATASIVVQEVNNVLLIPNQAISGSSNNPTVQVMVTGQPEERAVTLGASDDLQTEVAEGLQEGDIVLVKATTASTTGTTQQRSSGGFKGFPGGGEQFIIPGGR